MSYKLDNIDKRILFELDKNARIADTQIAKLIRKSKESVRYRIKKLEEEGIITGYSTWIDPSNLGFMSAKIYLTLANKPKQKEELINYVKNDKRLLWLGVAEGAWNMGLTFFVKSNEEFYDLKNELFAKFKDIILESKTANLVEVLYTDKKFLYDEKTKWKTVFKFNEKYELKNIEKDILKELFKNSRINIVDIANKHSSTVDIIRNRIKKLEQAKIISRYTVNIDYNKLGYEFYKTFLYFRSFDKSEENRLVNYAKNQKNVIHLIKQISPWDIELEIMCESYHEYNKIINELTKLFPNTIQKVETAIMSEDYVFASKQMIFE